MVLIMSILCGWILKGQKEMFSKVLREGELLFSACGSPHYAAPEVISAKEKNVGYGLEVDMWAVGVITYTLLCCQYPFDGENDAEVIKRVLAGEFCFPDHVTISPEAQDFVRSLITVSREQRATAGGLHTSVGAARVHDPDDELQRALARELVAAHVAVGRLADALQSH